MGFLLARLLTPEPAVVNVYLNGELYASASMDEPQTITVTQDNGSENVIVIDETGVRMEYSTCINQICVHQGTLTPNQTDALATGNWIVCLPNGVTVELTQAEDAP